METYFTIGKVPPEAYVGFMLMKIVPRHLNEIKQYHSLDYLAFREKLVEVFEEPDLATAYHNALASLSQTATSPSQYICTPRDFSSSRLIPT